MHNPELENPSISLPEIVNFIQTSQHDTAWSDHYGALYVAAMHCDIDPPKERFPYIWQHGCFGPWIQSPELHFYNAPNPHSKKIFVARKDEVELLNTAGYNNIHAIGLPITYLPNLELERIPNSLLVMPQHTLVGMKAGTEEIRDSYVESLKPYIKNFDLVTACISPSCIANGMYVKSFEKLGIEHLTGALTSDMNAYLRIKCLMQQFEYMTTNTWGSHVAYALYFGMKVSFYGNRFEIKETEYLKDTTISSLDPKKRTDFINDYEIKSKGFFKDFHSTPLDGKADQELGSFLVGDTHKRSPRELLQLFDWA